MSRQHPEDYDTSFFEAVEQAHWTGELSIPCTLREASNYRSEFYHFRRVLREHSHPLAEKANALKFSISGKGLLVYLKGAKLPLSS